MIGRLVRVGLRHLAGHRLQAALMLLGIAIGVAVVVAIDIANASVRSSFRLTVASLAGKATHQVVGSGTGVDADLYRRLRVDLGVRECAPVIEDYVEAVSLDGRMMRLLGVDPFADGAFRSYLLDQTGSHDAPLGDLTAFLTRPGAVLISADLARQFGVTVGQPLEVTRGGRRVRLTVAGLLKPTDASAARALSGLLIADIATAQEVFDSPQRLSHIDLLIDAAHPEVLRRVETALPAGVRIEPVRKRGQSLEQLTASFELNLFAVSLLTLVVGAFLVFNTVTFFVVQRRGVFATLRALGVTREQLFAAVMAETLTLGVVASLLGLGLGVLLGQGAVRLVTRTINDLYFVLTVTDTAIEPFTLIKGFIVGVGAALVSAVVPAWEAASVPPAGGLRRSVLEARVGRAVPWVSALGVLLFVGGQVILAVPSRRVDVAFAAILLEFIGAALLVPLATMGLMKLAGPVARVFGGVAGRLASRAVVRSLSRSAVAVAALMVAVSIIVGLDVMVGSFRRTVDDWLGVTLQADIFVSTPAGTASRSDSLERTVAREIAALGPVDHVDTARLTKLDTPDYGLVFCLAVDGDVVAHRQFIYTDGSLDNVRRAIAQGAVIVSEPFAYRHGIRHAPGQAITLPTQDGPRSFPISGIYYDYGTERGSISMAGPVYRAGWHDDQISSIAVYLRSGVDVEPFANTLRARFAQRIALDIMSNRTLRATALSIFDRTFAITNALRALVMLVAFIGVLSTLMALQLERRREMGVLRAVGMTVNQLARAIVIETGLMGGVAGVLALPVGTLLAYTLVHVVNPRSFGWTMAFVPRFEYYVSAFVIAVAAGLLAGIYPAWRFSRVAPAEALRSE